MKKTERLFEWLEEDKSIRAVAALQRGGVYGMYGLGGSAKAAVTANLLNRTGKKAIIIVPTAEQQHEWLTDLHFFAPERQAYSFPVVPKASFTVTAGSLDFAAKRMEALTALRGEAPCFVIATAVEAAQFIAPPQRIDEAVLVFSADSDYNRDTILTGFVDGGYERTDLVDRRGSFSVRGDIIDVYPVNEDQPVRLEFFGDTLEHIRYFDINTQKSQDDMKFIRILPFAAVRDAGEEEATLLDYGENAYIIWDEGNRVKEELKKARTDGEHDKEQLAAWRNLISSKGQEGTLFISLLAQSVSDVTLTAVFGFTAKLVAAFRKEFTLLKDEILNWIHTGCRVVFIFADRRRSTAFQNWLRQNELAARTLDTGAYEPGLYISEGEIQHGFELPYAKTVVLAERDVYGTQKKRLRRRREKGQEINAFTDLKNGDYVVHETHGIGRYMGIATIETDGIHKDYLEVHYAGSDTLYVPTDQLELLQRYIGNDGEVPRLHRMGGADWKKIRLKAQKSIDDLAEKLIALYAAREVVPGYAFPPDTSFQREFEDTFPYEETQDQLRAVAEIKESMEKPVPMDCLVCGDVGFGKTEVALRAAFKAVMGGKQVAVLVPTTVLAQQHYQTFTERFQSFAVTCDVLNRFRSIKERKVILEKLAAGNIDILIGTHSILNKNVRFKDAGLLIVDEEQRFGVAQKEKWKSWATGIDVLTLSATPIPRTLHMSLVHLRQMCLIETPPTDRLPVQTYVTEYDAAVVRDAVMREKRRGGQVFFVYNRVASMARMKVELKAILPDVTIGMAHGQMAGNALEATMFAFYEGEYDVLLCSSLVENGLDIANANTIIVYDADRFGLSQLYQMRGRVGRSYRMAYAYFLYRRNKILSEVAEKRLQAVKDFTELGSGFKIAMRDLEIRGAGNLLGREQHGNIAGVGFAMYCRMLEDAVRRLQHEGPKNRPEVHTVMDIHVDAFIDETYIQHGGQKIEMYQRLALAETPAQVNELEEELRDRYGKPTEAVEKLLTVTRLRLTAQDMGIVHIGQKASVLEIRWQDGTVLPDPDTFALILRKRCRRLPGFRSAFQFDLTGIPDVLSYLDYILKACRGEEAANG